MWCLFAASLWSTGFMAECIGTIDSAFNPEPEILHPESNPLTKRDRQPRRLQAPPVAAWRLRVGQRRHLVQAARGPASTSREEVGG